MPITLKDIKAHQEQFGLYNLETMSNEEYKKALSDGAFFWVDHHDFVRSTFSEEIFATSCEQLDALISHLQGLRSEIYP